MTSELHHHVGKLFVASMTAATVLVLSGCDGFVFPSSETFRFRWTVKVKVDGKTYVGSSVVESIQRKGQCLMRTQGSFCGPKFEHRGVAPVIRLPDGAMIVPSLWGYYEAPTSNNRDRIDWRGAKVSSLPWFLYVPTPWGLSKDKLMVRLPAETPPLEIPFEKHRLATLKPAMLWVPAQTEWPPRARYIGPKTASRLTGLQIELVSFAISKTNEPLVELLSPAPPWMAVYRDRTLLPYKERTRRIRIIGGMRREGWTTVGRSNIESSKSK